MSYQLSKEEHQACVSGLRAVYKELKPEAKARLVNVKKTVEYVELEEQHKALEKAVEVARKKMVVLEKAATEEYIDFKGSWGRPSYGRTQWSSGIETNIHNDVIVALKGLTRISKLRHSDIERIVENLIAREKKRNGTLKAQESLEEVNHRSSRVKIAMRNLIFDAELAVRAAERVAMYARDHKNVVDEWDNRQEKDEREDDRDIERARVREEKFLKILETELGVKE